MMIIKSLPPKRNFFMEVKEEEVKKTPVKIRQIKSEDYTTDAIVDEEDIEDNKDDEVDEPTDYNDEDNDSTGTDDDNEDGNSDTEEDNEDTTEDDDSATSVDNTDNEEDNQDDNVDEPTDYSGDNGEDSGAPEDSETDGEEIPEGDSPVEHLRKYNLYRELGNVFSVVKNMISRLENTSKDTIEGNLVINSVLDKLRSIEELIYQYIVIKFRSNTYIQSLYFYESIVASVNMTLKLMNNNKDYIK